MSTKDYSQSTSSGEKLEYANDPNAPVDINDIEACNEEEILSHRLKNVLSNPDAVERIASLSRTLSRRVHADGPFQVNPDDFDLRVMLDYLKVKGAEQGIESSAAGVAFRNVTAIGVDITAAYGPSVEEMARNLWNWPKKFFKKDDRPLRKIIRNVNGVIEAGEMCLVIGRPGAGCSTLLKCCSGETSQLVSVEGDFSYDGLPQKDMMEKYKGYVIYNPELDTHFPHITVKNTLDFALKTKTPNKRINGISRTEYVDNMRDLWATVFGLRHTYSTHVGNDFVRGVSGGERKRVSIAEALACNGSVYSWDNATRGLDASTALEFSHAIRAATNLMDNSALVAIYQAGENIYELFDKVTVLYLGRQIYFGPAVKAKKYFENMGWHCPPRMTTPEFLTSVSDPNGRYPKPGFENSVPKTADEFEAYWHNSSEFQECIAEYDAYMAKHPAEVTRARLAAASRQSKDKLQRSGSQFNASYLAQVGYLMTRGFQRARGEMAYQTIFLSTFLIISLVIGSLYWDIPESTAGAYSRGSILCFCLIFCALSSLAEISHAFSFRPIILKQKSYTMYHHSAEALQEVITEMPMKFLSIVITAVVVYWMAHLKHEAGAFFQFLLFIFLAQQCMSFMFKIVSTLTKDGGTAHAIAGLLALILPIYTGFILPLPHMHHWAKWINWINPMRYAYEQLIGTEFHGRDMVCDQLVPSGVGYENVSLENQVCSFLGSLPGNGFVNGDDYIKVNFNYSYSHVWRNFGINIAWTIAFIIINTVLSEFVQSVAGGGDMLLYKRGHLPAGDAETADGRVASMEEMMVALNGEDVDIAKVIAERDVFTWQNLNYVIPLAGGHRQLLNDIQGYVKPGTMTALMGESGAGKTTLLNVLSQRINFGVITGDMLVNGAPIDSSFQRRTGYVQQQDLHLAEYSVRESLQFSAELRQPQEVSIEEKHAYVEKIIELLGMTNYAESIVGQIGRGLNVEQRKKLSIGVELVAKPSLLLFLDEPTSGLDSQSAWSIIQFLRSLADSGQAILCTIHQPSATLFEVFDRLLLLKKGGRTVYFGDIGPNSETMLSYFERQSGIACGRSENPAEYILNRIGAGATASVDADWGDLWMNSPEKAIISAEIDQLHLELPGQVRSSANEDLTATFATSLWEQYRVVFKRTGLQFWRSPIYIRAKFFEAVVCSLFSGFSFNKINHSVAGASQPLLAMFMMLIISLALINQMQVFAYDSRELFEVRESASNTFHWSTLLMSQAGWEIIYCWVCQFLCWACFYWAAGLPGDATRAGYFFLVYVLMFPVYYVSYGLWVIYFSPDVPSASMINAMLFSFMLLFCGILQPYDLMPGFWTFMYKFSPYTYFVQSFVAPLVHDRWIKCEKEELNIFNPPSGQTCGEFANLFVETSGGYLTNPDATAGCEYCAYTDAADVMATFNIKWEYRWRNFGFMFAYISFNFVAMLSCYYLVRVKVWNFNFVDSIKKMFNGGRKERHEPSTNVFAPKAGDEKVINN